MMHTQIQLKAVVPSDTASRQALSKRDKHAELFPFFTLTFGGFTASDAVTCSKQLKCWPISHHSRALDCIQALPNPNLPFQTLNHPLLSSCTELGSSVGSMGREKALCKNTQLQQSLKAD